MSEAKIYYQEDCNISLLEGKTIAVIGYGSQGHAHALNAKESGCNVIIGLYEGSKSWAKAEKQVAKLEDVLDIKRLEENTSITRELILVKIRVAEDQRQSIVGVTDIFRGKIVDVSLDSMIIELIGTQSKLDAFLELLVGYEILELARTGITGLTRGSANVVYLD